MLFRNTLYAVFALSLLSSCSGGSDGVLDGVTDGAMDSVAESTPFPLYSDDQNQFLADNAARESVLVTSTGLQYEVLVPADGPKPTAQSNVTVHYAGTLTDGKEFDSSYARSEPATFNLGGTIPGWIEGVQLMSVGSQYRFVLPSDIAYGDRGAGSIIGPGDALIFIVELLEIN